MNNVQMQAFMFIILEKTLGASLNCFAVLIDLVNT